MLDARIEKTQAETELLKDGMLSLLRFRVNRLCSLAIEQGYLYVDERLDLDELFRSYELLGGNSQTKSRYTHIISKYETKDRQEG